MSSDMPIFRTPDAVSGFFAPDEYRAGDDIVFLAADEEDEDDDDDEDDEDDDDDDDDDDEDADDADDADEEDDDIEEE